jgi:hypothetical protein
MRMLCLFGLVLAIGCSRGRSEGVTRDSGSAPGRDTDPAAVAGSAKPIASSPVVASAEAHGTRVEGPRTENMGRNFEGRLRQRVTGPHPLELRYLSRGERGRLQIERPGSEPTFDAIFAGDQAIVLDHSRRRYRTFDLNRVDKKSEKDEKVDVERTQDRKEIKGLLCYPWQLKSGAQQISACVRGLPGPFDTDKLETLSGLNVPAWVETLIGDRYLPVEASVTEGGRKVYELVLEEYSPDEVPENELSVPANYQAE